MAKAAGGARLSVRPPAPPVAKLSSGAQRRQETKGGGIRLYRALPGARTPVNLMPLRQDCPTLATFKEGGLGASVGPPSACPRGLVGSSIPQKQAVGSGRRETKGWALSAEGQDSLIPPPRKLRPQNSSICLLANLASALVLKKAKGSLPCPPAPESFQAHLILLKAPGLGRPTHPPKAAD